MVQNFDVASFAESTWYAARALAHGAIARGRHTGTLLRSPSWLVVESPTAQCTASLPFALQFFPHCALNLFAGGGPAALLHERATDLRAAALGRAARQRAAHH